MSIMPSAALMNEPGFSTRGAQKAAAAGQLELWIYAYLRGGEWANIGLLEGLQNSHAGGWARWKWNWTG